MVSPFEYQANLHQNAIDNEGQHLLGRWLGLGIISLLRGSRVSENRCLVLDWRLKDHGIHGFTLTTLAIRCRRGSYSLASFAY